MGSNTGNVQEQMHKNDTIKEANGWERQLVLSQSWKRDNYMGSYREKMW